MRTDTPAPDWRQSLLRTMLRLSGGTLLVAAGLATLLTHDVHWEFLAPAIAGAGSFLLLRWVPAHQRLVSAAYSIMLFGVIVAVASRWAWSPSLVVGLSFVVVATGVLHGRWAAWSLVICSAGLLLLGAALVGSGDQVAVAAVDTDVTSWSNWNRTALLFFVLGGAAVWILRTVVGSIASAESAAALALREAQQNIVAMEAARAERLASEKQLHNSQKLQTVAQLGEGFAHVFNNVLTVVRCACDEIRGADSPEIRRHAAEAIVESVSKCASTTSALVLLSRPHEEQRTTLVLERRIDELRAEIARQVRDNVRLEYSLAQAGPVSMPATWLAQILLNLVLNAEQAMPGGGVIRVSTQRIRLNERRVSGVDPLPTGDYAAIVVSDTGEGMPPEVLQHACEPFFTTRGRGRHDGLGLTMVHDMARSVGGTVEFRSEGTGATVIVYLPRIGRQSASEDGGAAAEPDAVADGEEGAEDEGEPGSDRRALSALGGDDEAPASRDASPPPVDGSPAAAQAEPEAERTRAPAEAPTPGRSWREPAFNQLSRVASVAGLLIWATTLIAPTVTRASHLMISFGVAAVAVAAWKQRWPIRRRVALLIVGVLGGSLFHVAVNSFSSPGPIAAVTFAVFIAAIFCGFRVVIALMLGVSASLVGIGWLWEEGLLGRSLEPYLPTHAQNWVRVAIVLPSVVMASAAAVLYLLDAARRQVADLESARARAERTRREEQRETQLLSDLEAARERASRTEAAGRLTGMVAHDLNNSLMGMMGWAELIEDAEDDGELQECITSIGEAAGYAEALVHQLQHERVLSHRGESIDAGSALARMRPMLSALLQYKGGEHTQLRTELGAACHVAIREEALRRLVLNLVANARDAMPRGGTCSVALRQDATQVELTVSDDGCGMDSATQSRLFDAFFTTKGGRGTGLGLHAVSEIVTGTGGSVEVWSELGRGSRFTVRWPLAEPPTARPQSSRPPALAAVRGRILLVEDDAAVRRMLARVLKAAGYALEEAADGDGGARFIESQAEFDVLCTDAIMPGLPTAELVERFHRRFPGRPVLVISGYLPAEMSDAFLERPEVHYLSKPFSNTRLLGELGRALGTGAPFPPAGATD